MTKRDFIKKVEKICLVKDCSISKAIDIAKMENKITDTEFISWFCTGSGIGNIKK
ncbi:hypothetical protein [Clostridium aciditolerans]|uniref:Uncharacterized protein n=1 Tax=Clostridium aciditolerans TaxID=339861 RepID=A0A934M6H2_9CLOT|nr:hypothetical protein [Clostridium aciditolerans]MBI6874588.1 hypothetical protein [Clostridium aciditolerans]